MQGKPFIRVLVSRLWISKTQIWHMAPFFFIFPSKDITESDLGQALGFEPRSMDYTVPLAGDIPAVKFPVWSGTMGRFVLGFLSVLGADDGSQEFWLTNYRNGYLSRDRSSFLLFYSIICLLSSRSAQL